MIYDSSKKFYLNNLASFLLELGAYLFSDTKIDTIEFAYMDVNNGTIPEEFKNKRIIPHIQFIPAGEDADAEFKTDLISDVQNFLEFIQINARTDLSKAFNELGLTIEKQEQAQSIQEDKQFNQEPEQTEEQDIHEDL